MRNRTGFLLLLLFSLLTLAVAACQPAAAPSQTVPEAPAAEEPAGRQETATTAPLPSPQPSMGAVEEPGAPTAPEAPAGEGSLPQPTQAEPQPSDGYETPPLPETRRVELEYPSEMQLGDSDVIRLTLLPSEQGYVLEAAFPDHQTAQAQIEVARPPGYDLFAVARLDGVAFDLTPAGEQARSLPPGESLTWNWSIRARQAGRQRLALTLLMRWVPNLTSTAPLREAVLFSGGMEVQVRGILGLPPAQAGRLGIGLLALVLLVSGGLYFARRAPTRLRTAEPNRSVTIETPPAVRLTGETESLLRALFHRYARLLVTHEFLSGYSGARTFLAQPIRADGRSDAYTIVKVGTRASIEQEYANYERFVRDTLPPMTARIQHAPIRLRTGDRAAVRYTFIGEAGRAPVSLRQALLANPDPELLRQIFTTFGPYWWQQRRPYTFTLASEYDRLLPTHYVVVPEAGHGKVLDGSAAPGEGDVAVGERVRLQRFPIQELRGDGQSYSLAGIPRPGGPALRVRWLGLRKPEGATGRVVATRAQLLTEAVEGMDLFGLPDPLPRLPALLGETIHGTQSVIHGDLNLENVLVGPGRLVWLIDFAQTREGHTLLDFAHLEAEIISRVLPEQFESPQAFLAGLASGSIPLLAEVEAMARQCLFDPANPREYRVAAVVSCLGALKYANLEPAGRHLLYLAAAYWAESI
jgi:hypothetical protein